MRPRVSMQLMCGAVVAAMACAPAAEPPPAQETAADPCAGVNTLTDAERADGWELLFDGSSMNGWHGYNGGDTESWSVEDCSLKTARTEGNYGSHNRVDLATDEEYANFELSLDWKNTAGGNSGIFYAVVEDPKYSAAWMTGPEYALLDDVDWPEELEPERYTGADYGIHAPSEDKQLKPVGEWNSSKIVVNGSQVEHWLNGGKIVEFERWTDDWKARFAATGWEDRGDYGLAKSGHIVIQDHGSELWFRNIQIRELGTDSDDESGDDQ
jgi:hypothetical protein